MNVELDQLRKLPIAEKLRIVEQLWDDIAASDEPLVLRDWHIAEAQRRDASGLEFNRPSDSRMERIPAHLFLAVRTGEPDPHHPAGNTCRTVPVDEATHGLPR